MRPVFEARRYPEFGPAQPLSFSADRNGRPVEGGVVQFSWNWSGLYVHAELEDSCLVAKRESDQQLHYLCGDVLELFVKPLNAPYKWEMYATPSGNRSTLFFPTWPTALTTEEALNRHSFRGLEIRVEKASWGWTAEMSVSASQLTAFGANWGGATDWTVLCGRYNYNSDDLKNPELSMAPVLSRTDFHLTEEYALLSLSRS